MGGARLEFEFEFEQLLPGGDNPDADDACSPRSCFAVAVTPARRSAFEALVEWDPRCLEAHAHHGILAFGTTRVLR